MKYVVEISDADGNACRVRLSLPFVPQDANGENSSWRVLDEGFLKYRSGGCGGQKPGFNEGVNIYLGVGGSWHVRLDRLFDSWTLVNASGNGEVGQPICVSLKPGPITWALIE